MTCQNCARHVTEAIQSVPGVSRATVLLEPGQVSIHWRAETAPDVPAVIAAVQQAGYQARELPAETAGEKGRYQRWQVNLWFGIAVTAGLMIGEWGLDLASKPWF